METKEKVCMEDVLQKAREVAPHIMYKYNLPTDKFSSDDIVGAFLLKCIENGFVKRYDSSKSSLNSFVYTGLKNVAISMTRKFKHEGPSLDDFAPWGKKLGHLENRVFSSSDLSILAVDYQEKMDMDILWDEVMAIADDIEFDAVGTIIDGEVYLANAASVIRLRSRGYRVKEIAEIFGVCRTTICVMLSKVKSGFVEYACN
jgi:DNA-directed RNA polymerase specialized sigma24 family protein